MNFRRLTDHFLCNLFLFPLLLLAGGSFGQIINVSQFKEATLIGDRVSYFEDVSGEMTYDQVINSESEYTQGKRKVFGRPATNSTIWVHFEANSTSDEHIWLDVHNSNIQDCQFYKLDHNDQLTESFSTGSLLTESSRLRNVHTFWFPLIAGGDKATYRFLIKVKTGIAIELPLYVGPEYALYENTEHDNWMAIAFIGGLIGLFIYNLFFFFSLRRAIYFFYSLNVLSFLFVVPFFNNFPVTNYLFGNTFTHAYTSTWIWIPFMTSALFTSQYLRLRLKAPKLRYFLIAFVIYYILLIPFALIWPSPVIAQLYLLSTLLFYFSSVLIGYYMLFVKKEKRALLYAIGWTAMFLSIIVVALVRNGIIAHSLILRNSSYIGIFIEMFVFAIAIGKYMNVLRTDQIKLYRALKESNEELVELNQSLDSFNYHVSHDLKTVMNNSNALAQMITKYNEREDKTKIKEIAEKLFIVTKNGGETVQSFLSLGRVDDILRNESETPIELEKELHGIIDRNDLNDGIRVTVLTDQIGTLTMHVKAFESIFLNLITNAIKYNNNNTAEAEVQFIMDAEDYIFIFSDNGIGIDTKKFGNVIFEPFQRGDYTEGQEGTGVGLYLVKRIITAYKGKISVESELGNGSTFTIRIPMER